MFLKPKISFFLYHLVISVFCWVLITPLLGVYDSQSLEELSLPEKHQILAVEKIAMNFVFEKLKALLQ